MIKTFLLGLVVMVSFALAVIVVVAGSYVFMAIPFMGLILPMFFSTFIVGYLTRDALKDEKKAGTYVPSWLDWFIK